MPAEVTEIWNFVLYSTGSGTSLTVGDLVAVLLVLVGGYFASRLFVHFLGQRLASTRLSAGSSSCRCSSWSS
ncbi:MAG: hypothetical protein P8X94_11610 [Woeseiaceae bacterium]